MVHRHEFHCGDAECGEVLEDGRVRQTGERAAKFRWHCGMAHRETPDVQLVDDGVRPRRLRMPVRTPIEIVPYHHGFRNVRRGVPMVLDGVVTSGRITENGV